MYISFTGFSDNHPVLEYFKSEYKKDWEYQYLNFIDQKKSERKGIIKRIFNIIGSFTTAISPNEKMALENRLAQCKTIHEVEEVQRNWDRRLNNRGLAV